MKLLVHGTGVMGQLCCESARQKGWEVASADDFTTEKGDVILSFSHFSRMESVLSYAHAHKTPIMIATTGWGDDISTLINKFSQDIAILPASNTSLGVNTLHAVLQHITPLLSKNFDIEIVEKHHNKKVDAPSGTANSLAQTIVSSASKKLEVVHGRSGSDAKRASHELGVHAVRGGTVVGEHTVSFYGDDEIIEISHTALSKKVFVQGALAAAEFLVGKPAGLYNMGMIFNQ
ncbi:MAG: 4-hydroxy-tetrahydrodipicolinate reductase [Brevinema sp.]